MFRTTFIATGLSPIVELEQLPEPGDVSQGVVDHLRRPVLSEEHGPLPDGSSVLVRLGDPMRPEGAWSLAADTFAGTVSGKGLPPLPPYHVGKRLVFAGRRCNVYGDDGRIAVIDFSASGVVPENAREGVAKEAEQHFRARASWTGGEPVGINLVLERLAP